MVNLDYVTPFVVLSGLLGSISWIYGTSMLGLPVSASHALIGGYAGAVISRAQILNGFDGAFDALVWSGWIKPMLFIVASPILGLLVAYTMMLAVFWAFRKTTPHRMDVYFRRLQLVSSAVFSYSHGTNDAQKTMAIITVRPPTPANSSTLPPMALAAAVTPPTTRAVTSRSSAIPCSGTWRRSRRSSPASRRTAPSALTSPIAATRFPLKACLSPVPISRCWVCNPL
jgi:phosphate/sulfate permease